MCNGQPDNQSQSPQPADWQQGKGGLNSIWKKDMPCLFYCPPDCPIHRSHDIEKRRQTEGEGKLSLPNLLKRQFLPKEEKGKLARASARYEKPEKAKPTEEARAGYEKANPSHRRGDYHKIHISDSKEAKDEEMAKRYPNTLDRELICSCAGQWVLAETTDTPASGNKLREAPHDHQHVPADIFEISELGVLFDISLSQYISDDGKGWYLGDLKVKHFMLSLTDMEGTEHAASVSHFLQDDDGNTFPQRLQWSNGEVWTRKRPELEKLNGHWHRFLPDGRCAPMSVPLQTQINHGPNGELEIIAEIINHGSNGEIILSLDGEKTEKLWVFMEQDPEHPGSHRLRWSNGQVWHQGEIQGSIEFQSGEDAPEIVSPPDSFSLLMLHVQSAEDLLAHIQNRGREIQELLSSVEEVEEVDHSMVSAAIVEDESSGLHIPPQSSIVSGPTGNWPFHRNLQGVIEL